ncbi:MAG TPA: hypothetical protein VNG90_00780, partial [Candidatus Acidoferrum sp.]|nr:hypothetical protein [Candidatus Acidoferrum sp.]
MIQDRIEFETDPNQDTTPEVLHANEATYFTYETGNIENDEIREALEGPFIQARGQYMTELGWREYGPGEDDRDEYDTPEAHTTCIIVPTPEREVSAGYRLTPLSIEALLEQATLPELPQETTPEAEWPVEKLNRCVIESNSDPIKPYKWPLSLGMWGERRQEAAEELAQCILELEEIGFVHLWDDAEQTKAYDMTRLFTRSSLMEHQHDRKEAITSTENMFRAFGLGMAVNPGMWVFNTTPNIVKTLSHVGIDSVVVAEAVLSPEDLESSLLCIIPDIRVAYMDMLHQP